MTFYLSLSSPSHICIHCCHGRCSDSFFIYPSDNPGSLSVSQPLNGENYTPWCWAMKMILVGENKFGLVHSFILEPGESQTTKSLCELVNTKPAQSCNCGRIQPWMEYTDMEHVMQFLMGLNDSLPCVLLASITT
uniref:Retrotransposon Copia-like N-terminal domain-containing protein n=1 Tax=Phaseolus vulgaris TaxID=3885 RepID=V7CXR7_PHAVU|nr:hypothetical protein PHAVU_001G197600g [Phaseolus vulgaris]ESW34992.1 hypothetical protein PHAVU_001G197600g [Phaseolus vulgaris]